MSKKPLYILAICVTLTSIPVLAEVKDPWLRPKAPPYPENNKSTVDRVELGRSLFFDPRLSGSNWISCATCHNPTLSWTDGLPTAIGHNMKVLGRSAPTLINTGFNYLQFWDGRKPSLEEQALGPITAPDEMNQPIDELLKELAAIPGYVQMFEKAYPGEGITEKSIGKAIASYERTILSTESPFDRWRKGDQKAISADAKSGFALFNGKANCVACHMGFNFTDNGFHNIGLKSLGGDDLGRFAHRPVKISKGAFKTPTLRDIAVTAPYMRNGMYKTLEEVVDHYDRGGDVKENLDPNIQPLGLTPREKADLVEFLRTLTGKPAIITLPTLPR